MRGALSVVALAASLGCTSQYQLRGTQAALPCKPVSEFVLNTYRQIDTEARSIEDYCTFKLGVIELSEDGFYNPEQFNQVTQMLRDGTASGGIILTFVHGWHHDARVCDDNLACFRRIVDQVAQLNKNRHVTGLYVGWRGESLTPALLKYTTLPTRKPVAENAGRKGGTQLLAVLNDIWSKGNLSGKQTIMVTVGHSLGGAFLLSALKGSLTSEIQDVSYRNHDGILRQQGGLRVVSTEVGRDEKASTKALRARFGDLVVLLNPAIESNVYAPFDRDLLDDPQHVNDGPNGTCVAAASSDVGPYTTAAPPEHERCYSTRQLPVVITVASTADKAVGVLFPFGQWFAPWTNWIIFRQRSASFGLGHFKPQVTHSLTYVGDRLTNVTPVGCDCEGMSDAWPSIAGKIDLHLKDAQKLDLTLVRVVKQPDGAALENLSCECYSTLSREYERLLGGRKAKA